jgi:exo-1,4-beta-D-glucosaminidase
MGGHGEGFPAAILGGERACAGERSCRCRGSGEAVLALLVAALALLLPAGASATTSTIGLGGWQVQSSALDPAGGQQISQPGYSTSSWLAVKPDDAGGAGTEVGALVQNERCPKVFFSTDMANCFGYMSRVGPDTIPRFSVPWWFRTTFQAAATPGRHGQLIVNGVVGQADVWVNGTEVATQATVQGAFTRYALDVSSVLVAGTNAVALEVYPNNPSRMLTLDNVDWTQIPPDNNTGIQFPLQLHESSALAIGNAHVVQQDAQDLSSASLTLRADVTNNATTPQSGTVTATIDPPGGGAPITVERAVRLPGGVTRTVSLTAAEDPRLRLDHPQVWWPYQLGAQPLYGLEMAVSSPGASTDRQSETFAIRTITSRLVGPSPLAPQGVRQFAVNGRPFVFRAGGWSEDLFLRYSAADTASQIALIRNLGLNGIRTEGKEMPGDFYEQMDRAGILVDAGYQCCDNWQREESEKEYTARERRVLELSAVAIGERLRNHPSVMNFSWSDNPPTPKQEAVSLRGFAQADFQDPLIASAEYKGTSTLGPSGEKEGPYDWVPPGYWYDASHYNPEDPSRTNAGGAWAFDSEASAGDTVPTMDSIKRFMSSYEQAQLWQAPAFNQYHLNYEPELPGPGNEGYSFGTLHSLDSAISARYGGWSSLDQYVQEAQVANYETQRAQFEAYIDHSVNQPTPSTGVVYWQLNKGWPTLLWDLYNNEYDQAGSYFGAKKADASVHAIYAYDTGAVTVDNLSGASQPGLAVEAKVYDIKGKLLDDRISSALSIPSQGVQTSVLTPKVPAPTAPPKAAKTYFVELLTTQAGRVIDRNVYWLSTQQDSVNWPATLGKPQATMSQFADLSALMGLPAAELRTTASSRAQAGPNGADRLTEVTITNVSETPTVGFFLRADIRRGSATGTPASGENEVLPVFWSDNDVTLWPGESVTLTAAYRASALRGDSAVVSLSGWNAPTLDVAAP